MSTRVKLKDVSAAPENDGRGEDALGIAVEGGFLVTEEQLKRIDPDPKRARAELRLLIADLRAGKKITGPTPAPDTVRFARPSDEEALYELWMMAHKENGTMFAPVSSERVWAEIHRGTRAKGNIIGVVDTLDGIVATCCLAPRQWWWSELFLYMDLINFVHPDHRKSRWADDLLAFECACADRMTERLGYTVYVMAGVQSLRRQQAKERLFKRHMNRAGGSFIYPFPPGVADG